MEPSRSNKEAERIQRAERAERGWKTRNASEIRARAAMFVKPSTFPRSLSYTHPVAEYGEDSSTDEEAEPDPSFSPGLSLPTPPSDAESVMDFQSDADQEGREHADTTGSFSRTLADSPAEVASAQVLPDNSMPRADGTMQAVAPSSIPGQQQTVSTTPCPGTTAGAGVEPSVSSFAKVLDDRMLDIVSQMRHSDTLSDKLQVARELQVFQSMIITTEVSQRSARIVLRLIQVLLHRNGILNCAISKWSFDRMPSSYGFLGIPNFPIERRTVQFGSNFRNRIPSRGIPISFFYRDPLRIISRLTMQTIYRYGTKVFDIKKDFLNGQVPENPANDSNRTFAWAQSGDFLLKVKARVASCLPDHPELIIVPIKIHADGAQMRANGMHSQTPVSISILHRGMFDPYAIPSVVSYLPKMDIKDLALSDDIHIGANWSADLKTSMTHAIMRSLFEPLLYPDGVYPQVLREKIIQLPVAGKLFQILPVIANFGCDMPMTVQLSFTLNSTEGQAMPCQACTVSGKDWFHYDASKQAPLRSEADTLKVLRNTYTLGELKSMNLRRLTEPFFEGSNPWTAPGIFAFTFVDRLHGVQGGIVRNLASVGLTMVFLYEESLRTATSEGDIVAIVPIVESDDEESENNDEDEDDGMSNLADDSAMIDGNGVVSGRPFLAPRRADRRMQDAGPFKLAKRLHNAPVPNRISNDIRDYEHGTAQTKKRRLDRTSKSPLEETSLSARVRRLRASTRGMALSALARNIRKEWIKTWPRRPSCMIPIRLSELCVDSLSKAGEHKYAIGLLLEVMSAVACDLADAAMGSEYRNLYNQCASKAILFYCALSHKNPTKTRVEVLGDFACNLMNAIQTLKRGTHLKWDAPKIHNLVHYARSIRLFGRCRLTDTCEGEASMKEHKVVHARVAPKDLHDCAKQLLSHMEHRDMTELTRACLSNELHPLRAPFPIRTMTLVDYSRPAGKASFISTPIHTRVVDSLVVLEREGLGLPSDCFPSKVAEGIDIRFPFLANLIRQTVMENHKLGTGYKIECFKAIKVQRLNENHAQTIACGNQGGRTKFSQQYDFVYGMRRLGFDSPTIAFMGAIYASMRISLVTGGRCEAKAFMALVREIKRICQHATCNVCRSCSEVFMHCKLMDTFKLVPISCLAGRLTAFADVSDIGDTSKYLIVDPSLFHNVEFYA